MGSNASHTPRQHIVVVVDYYGVAVWRNGDALSHLCCALVKEAARRLAGD